MLFQVGWGQDGPVKNGLSALASIFWVSPFAKEVRVKVVSLFIPSSALLRTWLVLCAESRPSGRLRCPNTRNVSVPNSHPHSPAGLGSVMRVHRALITLKMNY